MDTNDGAPVKDCDAFRNFVGKFTWRFDDKLLQKSGCCLYRNVRHLHHERGLSFKVYRM